MKLLVLSDSHGNIIGIREAIQRNRDADAIIFLGDGISDIESVASADTEHAFYAVRGNCDFSAYIRGVPVSRAETLDFGRRIFITHGDTYGVKSGYDTILQAGVSRGADIVLFGHTHQPLEYYDSSTGVYLFNPGSISREYGGASFGIITLGNGEPLFSHGKL